MMEKRRDDNIFNAPQREMTLCAQGVLSATDSLMKFRVQLEPFWLTTDRNAR